MNITIPAKTRVASSGDIAVLRFEGDITSHSEDAVLGRYQALDAAVKKVLLDFSKVPYLNSSGIALVIQLLRVANKVPRKVVCFGPSAHFVKAFTRLGMEKHTTREADAAAARASVA